MLSIDFNDPAFVDDPYPFYRQLRAHQGPYWLEHRQTNSLSAGMWLFSRYDDVNEILKATQAISKQLTRVRLPENLTLMEQSMLNQDPPDHTRLRALLAPAFTQESLAKFAPRIQSIVDELIDNLQQQERPDFVRDFSQPLPMQVIASFMGIPYEDHPLFGGWARTILRGYDSGVSNSDGFRSYRGAIDEMQAYFSAAIERRSKRPTGDLISLLIEAKEGGRRLTSDELLSMCMLLIVSGYETTTNFLSSGMWTLLRHCEQWQLLQDHPQYLPSAMEEMLRFESPLQRATFRITTQACEFGGRRFKEGEQISLLLGAANRDESHFVDPEKFNILRSPNRHLAFGGGIHFCLGVFLARMEAKIALTSLLKRVPHMRLSQELAPQWNEKKLFRGLLTLPLTLG